eukprot:TRINITY_DN10901_c0_g1_i1.p1 TRINITY_DN10901_c0_g1~~TRINITY_DN10901_c0_g1_i1.p1  ORF type:complete len:239 (+),score=41.78 TRINITY_DN10901_c0_g1_i1:36-752(+)
MALPTKVMRIADQKRPPTGKNRRHEREVQLQKAYGAPSGPQKPQDVLKRFGVSQRRDSESAGQANDDILELIGAEHMAMEGVLAGRLVKLKACNTLDRQSYEHVLAHVISVDDDAFTVDVLPSLAARLRSAHRESQPSLGACFEMMPLLRKILSSTYSDYIQAALATLDALLDYGHEDFKSAANAPTAAAAMRSASVQDIYMELARLESQVEDLAHCDQPHVAQQAAGILTKLRALDD